MPKKDFPKEYLEALAKNHQEKVLRTLKDPTERLLLYSGSLLNWVGEYINDESIGWRLEKVPIDNITLTGTSPEWNEITIKRAERSPKKLRELFEESEIRELFKEAEYEDAPILITEVEGKFKVLDGMKRVIAAARDGIDEISAYIGRRGGKPQPKIEPHVVYDFIRAFQQRGGDEEDFKASVRFLVNAYSNTQELLKERFSIEWVGDEKTISLIKEAVESS